MVEEYFREIDCAIRSGRERRPILSRGLLISLIPPLSSLAPTRMISEPLLTTSIVPRGNPLQAVVEGLSSLRTVVF